MGLRVLIVDDSTHFLRAARTLLEREGVHVVAEASTSAEAIEHARSLRPDVTLIDIDLGDENGFDLASRPARATEAIAAPLGPRHSPGARRWGGRVRWRRDGRSRGLTGHEPASTTWRFRPPATMSD